MAQGHHEQSYTTGAIRTKKAEERNRADVLTTSFSYPIQQLKPCFPRRVGIFDMDRRPSDREAQDSVIRELENQLLVRTIEGETTVQARLVR